MEVTGTIRRTWRLGALLALAMTVSAVYLWQGNASAVPAAPSYSAVDLSDAVLFNTGPAAGRLDGLKRGQVAWTDTIKDGQAAVHEAIARDPQWAKAFSAGLQSGDPNKVTRSLNSLSRLALEALNKRLGSDRVDEAVNSIVKEAYGPKVLGILTDDGTLPFNFGLPPTYPCCLNPHVDPIEAIILVAYLKDIWVLDQLQTQVSDQIGELVTRAVTVAFQR